MNERQDKEGQERKNREVKGATEKKGQEAKDKEEQEAKDKEAKEAKETVFSSRVDVHPSENEVKSTSPFEEGNILIQLFQIILVDQLFGIITKFIMEVSFLI